MSTFNFVIILLIGFIDYLGISLVYPIFAAMFFDKNCPVIAAEATAAYRGAWLGILIGLTPLTQFIFAPILGAISDQKGRKRALMFGALAGTIGYIFAVLGITLHSLEMLILYRISVGLASGTVSVAQATIADVSQDSEKAHRFSLFHASLGCGCTLGPYMGAQLTECGYSIPFAAAGILSFIGFFVIAWSFPETRQFTKTVEFKITDSISKISNLFRWRHLSWLFATTFALSFGWSFFNEFMPLLLLTKFSFGLSEIGYYYAYGGAWFALCSAFISPWILKRFSQESIALYCLVGCAAGMLSFLSFEQARFIWIVLPVLMLSLSFAFPTTAAMVSNRTDKETQGEALGTYQSAIGCAMSLSPFCGGAAIGIYPQLAAVGGGLTMAIAAVIFWRGIKQHSAQIYDS